MKRGRAEQADAGLHDETEAVTGSLSDSSVPCIVPLREGRGDFSRAQGSAYRAVVTRLGGRIIENVVLTDGASAPVAVEAVVDEPRKKWAEARGDAAGAADGGLSLQTIVLVDSAATQAAVMSTMGLASWPDVCARVCQRLHGASAVCRAKNAVLKHTWLQRCGSAGRWQTPNESEIVTAWRCDVSAPPPAPVRLAPIFAMMHKPAAADTQTAASTSMVAAGGDTDRAAELVRVWAADLSKEPWCSCVHPLRVSASTVEASRTARQHWYTTYGPHATVAKEDGIDGEAFATRPFAHGTASDEPAADPVVAARAEAFLAMAPAALGKCDVFTSRGCDGRGKIAAFDLDGTLIAPKSGAKWCERADDWKWAFPGVLDTLKTLYAAGYKIVIFTNQRGITQGKTTRDVVRARVEAVITAMGVPCQAFIASDDDGYRKPRPGMLYLCAARCNDGVPIDLAASLYVGDAAGRSKTATRHKDHSASDMEFALNCGMPFATPEALFLRSSATHDRRPLLALATQREAFLPGRDIRAADAAEWTMTRVTPLLEGATLDKLSLVLLVGPPVAGKSTLARTVFAHCERVNQDQLRTKERCLATAERSLVDGKSVVVDATNAETSSRAVWIALGRKYGAHVRAVHVDVPAKLALHLNAVRVTNPLGGIDGPSDRRSVPDMAVYGISKKIQPPTTAEGFDRVDTIPFCLGPFSDGPPSSAIAAADAWQRTWARLFM